MVTGRHRGWSFCTFEVYVGTTTEVGLGERVVLQLTESLRGEHYHDMSPTGDPRRSRPVRLRNNQGYPQRLPRDFEAGLIGAG